MANALDSHVALPSATEARADDLEYAPNGTFGAEKVGGIPRAVELEGIEDPKAWASGKKCKFHLPHTSTATKELIECSPRALHLGGRHDDSDHCFLLEHLHPRNRGPCYLF